MKRMGPISTDQEESANFYCVYTVFIMYTFLPGISFFRLPLRLKLRGVESRPNLAVANVGDLAFDF